MDIRIENMREEDLPEVMEIEKMSFSSPWSWHSFLRDINDNSYAMYLTAKYEDKVVGYVGSWLLVDEIHITNLAVAPNYRQQGIATKLITETIRKIKSSKNRELVFISLEVRKSNKPAIKLYQKLGFDKVDIRPEYYRDNQEDALIMRKELDNE